MGTYFSNLSVYFSFYDSLNKKGTSVWRCLFKSCLVNHRRLSALPEPFLVFFDVEM